MWVEGYCFSKDFPSTMEKHLTTIPSGQSEPLWQSVSSNVGGTSSSDDGYVFYSKGTSGKDNIYINVKNYYNGLWTDAHKISVTDSYTPNEVQGQNGKFGTLLTDNLRYHYDKTYNGTSMEDHTIWYGMSITKDRVIIVIRNPMSVGFVHGVVFTMYLGLINRYSNEIDSSAISMASSHNNNTGSAYNLRVLRNKQFQTNVQYELTHRDMLYSSFGTRSSGRAFGNKMYVTPALVHHNVEGIRGEIDGMLFGVGTNDPLQRPPYFARVEIEGKKYIMVTYIESQYRTSYYNSFGGGANNNVTIFIEMK
jgi:hypothetical protein